jgi:cysteine desulfurase
MRIYLDHNATTPVRAEVVDAMTTTLRENYGNPSSTHEEGAHARAALDGARGQVARLLGTDPGSVYFTGSATESNNTVLMGLLANAPAGQHLVTSSVEHPSVVEPCSVLEGAGCKVERVPVDEDGLLDPEAILAALRPETSLVSLIWANNETGVVQPMEEIAGLLAERGVPLHVDATQAVGKWPIDLSAISVAYLSCSAHKFNGPKGVGALVTPGGAPIEPLLLGGPQEKRLRGGTENMAGIVGLGMACELAQAELDDRIRRYASLRDRLWQGIESRIESVRRNGSVHDVLPNTLNVEFEGVAGEVLLQALDLEGVAVSAGAACHSGSISPSHVLTAMGRTPEQSRASLRLSIGHGVDMTAIDRVISLLCELVPRVRSAEVA